MSEQDRPPESIWLDPEAQQEHFERVMDRYRQPGTGGESVPDLDDNDMTTAFRR